MKALSEGDWRLGKGALASWADWGLRTATDYGAKVLRLGSGDKVRITSLSDLVSVLGVFRMQNLSQQGATNRNHDIYLRYSCGCGAVFVNRFGPRI